MSRIVLEIRRNGQTGELWTSLKEPGTYQDALDFFRFGYDRADREPAGFTAGTLGADEVGTYIITKLSEHPAVPDALRAALAAQTGTQEPVLIRAAPQAEDVPWETLFAGGCFLALDPRWPIGRMSTQDTRAEPREFRPPLRVMAVLAAAGVDAEPQWAELREALRVLPFEVTVRVLAAQDTLLAAAKAGNPANLMVTAERVQPGLDLPVQITGFRPNILHFFCHGGVVAGSSFLEIATRGTASSDHGAVSFELKDFPAANPADDLWLVVLNACKGALPPSGASSLVSSLAARGVPAVAGMREAVTETDAHAFCRGFYRALAGMLAPLAETEDLVPVTWCAALYQARREICERHRGSLPCTAAAAQFREWTLPVMYVGSAPFVLYRAYREQTVRAYGPPGSARLPPEQRTELESQLQILRDLSERRLGAPPGAIVEYQRRIWELQRALGS
jgi:CHAT domain